MKRERFFSKIRENNFYCENVYAFKGDIIALCMLSLVGTFMFLPAPLLVQQIIDNLSLVSFPKSELYVYSLMLLLIFLAASVISYIAVRYSLKLSYEFRSHLKGNIYSRALRADYNSLMAIGDTDIQARATRDADVISYITPMGLNGLIVENFRLVFLVALLLYTNVQMTVLLSIMIPISYVSFRYLSRPLYELSKGTHEGYSNYNNALLEGFQSVRECQINSSYDYHGNKIKNGIEKSEMAIKKFSVSNLNIKSIMGGIPLSITVMIWVVGGSLIIDNYMSIGELLAFMIYLSMLYKPVSYMFGFMANIHFDFSAIERVEKLLSIDQQRSGMNVVDVDFDKISFKNISLSYGEKNILDECSFSISRGEIACVSGGNGAGKTSLINVMLGLLNPKEGSIILNDDLFLHVDIEISSYRKLFGFVSQDVYVYDDSLKNNITLGEAYDDEKLMKLIHQVGLASLMENYGLDDTPLLSEKVSGGEKQKIGLARALFREPSILLFDEPSNHLDQSSIMELRNFLLNVDDIAVVLISHEEILQSCATRVFELGGGKLHEKA